MLEINFPSLDEDTRSKRKHWAPPKLLDLQDAGDKITPADDEGFEVVEGYPNTVTGS